MPEQSSELPYTPQEERGSRKHYQDRLKKMTQIMKRWNEFERSLQNRPMYYRALRLLQAEISQKWNVEKNRQQSECRRQSRLLGKQVVIKPYSWLAARKAVLTIERLDSIARAHGVDPDDIMTDVGKLASHSSWLSGVYARGEGGMLADANRFLEPKEHAPPIIMQPARPPPLVLRASEINSIVKRANEEYQRIDREFRSDDPPKPPSTDTFGFLKEVDRESSRLSAYETRRRKKPRKNWRKEIG